MELYSPITQDDLDSMKLIHGAIILRNADEPNRKLIEYLILDTKINPRLKERGKSIVDLLISKQDHSLTDFVKDLLRQRAIKDDTLECRIDNIIQTNGELP